MHRLYEMEKAGTLLFPAINVNDSVTKSQVRQPLRLPPLADRRPQPRHRRHAGRQGGGGLRLRRRGQGLRPGAAAGRGPAWWSPRSTPSARCRRPWRATRCSASRTWSPRADLFVTATGNVDVITVDHMTKMKDGAIVGNIGHFDNEIDMAGLKKFPGVVRTNIKPQYDKWIFPDGHCGAGAGRGAAPQPGLRHRPPQLRHVEQLHQPDHRPDRAGRTRRPVREEGLHAAQAPRREGGPRSTSSRSA